MNTIPSNIYDLIQHYNNIDLCNKYMFETYTPKHALDDREEVIEAVGLRWNHQKCTTVYYNICI